MCILSHLSIVEHSENYPIPVLLDWIYLRDILARGNSFLPLLAIAFRRTTCWKKTPQLCFCAELCKLKDQGRGQGDIFTQLSNIFISFNICYRCVHQRSTLSQLNCIFFCLQCSNGHLMCAGCFNHLLADARIKDETATCPNCRTEISRTICIRNLAVEKAVSELPSDCGFCNQNLPRYQLEYHQKEQCQER